MQLKELRSLLLLSRIVGDEDIEFSDIQMDSRKVKPGDLFICTPGIPGLTQDRHQFAVSAVQQGAVALVVEKDVDVDVPKLFVPDATDAAARISNHVYRYPSNKMKVIGVTGTNGKTTTTYLIEHILREQGFQTGLMGTICMKIGQEHYEVSNTTQETVDLQRNFGKMVDVGTDYCVMEVSSHALALGRVKGCHFRSAVFTNLTQDHLDYHRTMDNYKQAKGLLFSRLGNTFAGHNDQKFAVLNADDPAFEEYAHMTAAQVISYGIEHDADVRATNLRITSKGTEFTVVSFAGTAQFQMKLIGKFNVYNALGAITTTLAEGVSLEQIKNSLERVNVVDGRMEVVDAGQDFLVVVDYAHTPDGLENALSTIKQFAEGRIITVFGCGGDRDRTKRSIMGRFAAQYSDYVIVTSDNPRSENPDAILKEVEPGIVEQGFRSDQYELNADRKQAIYKAVAMAGPQDVVLIAGKGHETYQIINGVTYNFDDRLVAREAIRGIVK